MVIFRAGIYSEAHGTVVTQLWLALSVIYSRKGNPTFWKVIENNKEFLFPPPRVTVLSCTPLVIQLISLYSTPTDDLMISSTWCFSALVRSLERFPSPSSPHVMVILCHCLLFTLLIYFVFIILLLPPWI